MIKPKNAEIMSPVGSLESLHAAINAGCDSIYFGITQLNMRAKGANNMTIEDLKEISDICHTNNIKAYLTVNTIIYQHDMPIMHKIVDAAKENSIDAIIAADWSVILYCNKVGIPVHFSTQMSISNFEAVKFAAQFTNRVVLARELTLEQIKSIHEQIIEEKVTGIEGNIMEIECFVHGALCISQSGRCYMSQFSHNASANRGVCKQVCRGKYKVTDVDSGTELIVDNEYVMSPTDLCSIDFIDKLLDAGIQVFKIEGRGRAPEYVDTVTRTYKQALQDVEDNSYTPKKIEKYFTELKKVFNRGLSSGYYLGKKIGEYSGVHGSKSTKQKVLLGHIEHLYKKAGIVEGIIKAKEELSVGDEIMIIGKTTGVYRETLKELRVDGKESKKATQGDIITFPVSQYIRKNDKLYKWIDRKNFQ